MADFLVKILLETDQPVPEFFSDRVPEDKKLDFDDDSGDDEDDEQDTYGGGGDGGDTGGADAWGGGEDAVADTGFTPDGGFAAGDSGNTGTW